MILLLCAICNNATAQKASLEQVDRTLTKYFERIIYWTKENPDSENSADSIRQINSHLMRYLQKSLSQHPESIKYPFVNLQNQGMLSIISSDDGNVRLYCWDTETGGTMHFYNDVAQYKSNGIVHVSIINDVIKGDDNPDGGALYQSIIPIHTKSGRSIYIVRSFGVEASCIFWEGITAYEIKNGGFKKTQLFKARRQILSDIIYEYNCSSDDKQKEIHLSPDKQTLYIPIVINEKVTNRNLVYRFNGEQFVYDKNAKN